MSVVAASPTSAPQSKPVSSLTREIIMYIMAPDDPDALQVALDGINDGLDELNLRKWYWSVTFKDHTLVADQPTYTLNTDYKQSYFGQLRRTNGRYGGLTYLAPKNFESRYPRLTTAGYPSEYTVYNANNVLELQLSRDPSAGFVATYPTLRHYYHYRLQHVTKGGTIALPAEVVLYLKWYSKFNLATIFDMATKARLAERRYEKIHDKLVKDHGNHHHSDWGSRWQYNY